MGGQAPPAPGAGGPVRLRRFTFLAWGLLALVMAVVSSLGAWSLLSRGAPTPERLGRVPAFALTSSDGAAWTLESLRGDPWVADFIFTRCTGICPLLGIRMQEIQSALDPGARVRLVSISVDPQHDTPEVLAGYARQLGADPNRWIFLTGDWEETRTLIGDGFRLAVSRADPAEVSEGELVTHSDRLVLVDGEGEIRGYYHGSDEKSVRRILEDLERLAS